MEIDYGRKKTRRKRYDPAVKIRDRYPNLKPLESVEEEGRVVYRNLEGQLVFLGGNTDNFDILTDNPRKNGEDEI